MPTVNLSQAKAQLTKLLVEVERLGERIIITRSGRPAGVLLSYDEYEGLMETFEILADTELSPAIEQGLSDAEKGRVLSHKDLWDELEDPLHR